jgi:hypothetical protein
MLSTLKIKILLYNVLKYLLSRLVGWFQYHLPLDWKNYDSIFCLTKIEVISSFDMKVSEDCVMLMEFSTSNDKRPDQVFKSSDFLN